MMMSATPQPTLTAVPTSLQPSLIPSVTPIPSSSAVPFETPSNVPTPVPTLGVLSIPPEITVTPLPALI
jgi:hypothetical protein